MQNMIRKYEHENVSIAAGLEQRVFKCRVSSWSVKITNSLLPSFVATRSGAIVILQTPKTPNSTCPASSVGGAFLLFKTSSINAPGWNVSHGQLFA